MTKHPASQPASVRRVCVVMAVVAAAASGVWATPEDPVTVERAVFQQEKALAHMKELEERMFRLAELIRESQPDDSARLLLGVRKSRDELLGERMRQVAALVSSLDLRDATDEQKQILHELESLRTLLLTADLDTELKLEQLKLMREAIEKIDKLVEAETNQLNQTEPLAGQEAAAKPLMEALKGDEQRNAKTAEGIKDLVSKLDADAGKQAARVGAAGNDMNAAAGQLGEGNPGEAASKQKEAIRKLQDARDRIDEAREKLKKELEMTVRKQVMENLEDMLTRQTQVARRPRRCRTRSPTARPRRCSRCVGWPRPRTRSTSCATKQSSWRPRPASRSPLPRPCGRSATRSSSCRMTCGSARPTPRSSPARSGSRNTSPSSSMRWSNPTPTPTPTTTRITSRRASTRSGRR